jgi:methionyl-tRNA synthetase
MSQTPYFTKDGTYLGSRNVDGDCQHRNAEHKRERSCGCCSYYACPDCGGTFLVEYPD